MCCVREILFLGFYVIFHTDPVPTTEPPWTQVVMTRTSDNFTDPEGEITIFCETSCGYPRSNFSWYTYKEITNATTLFELFGDFRTDTASPCDQEHYTTTKSTLLISNDQYTDVAAFICRADNGYHATAASISIFRSPGSLSPGVTIGIVVGVLSVVAAAVLLMVIFVKKRKGN